MKATFLPISLIFGLFISGCTTKPPFNADPSKNNLATYKRDFADCKEVYPGGNAGAELKERLACMRLKGWN